MTIRRVALIFDRRARPETTGVYRRRALGRLVEIRSMHPCRSMSPSRHVALPFSESALAMRKLAKEFRELPLDGIEELLGSETHEDRMLAFFILVGLAEKGDRAVKRRVFDLDLANTRRVNNWDLVDGSALGIVGGYLPDQPRTILDKLARSPSLWERRIAIVSTLFFKGSRRRGSLLEKAPRPDAPHDVALRDRARSRTDASCLFARHDRKVIPPKQSPRNLESNLAARNGSRLGPSRVRSEETDPRTRSSEYPIGRGISG